MDERTFMVEELERLQNIGLFPIMAGYFMCQKNGRRVEKMAKVYDTMTKNFEQYRQKVSELRLQEEDS